MQPTAPPSILPETSVCSNVCCFRLFKCFHFFAVQCSVCTECVPRVTCFHWWAKCHIRHQERVMIHCIPDTWLCLAHAWSKSFKARVHCESVLHGGGEKRQQGKHLKCFHLRPCTAASPRRGGGANAPKGMTLEQEDKVNKFSHDG